MTIETLIPSLTKLVMAKISWEGFFNKIPGIGWCVTHISDAKVGRDLRDKKKAYALRITEETPDILFHLKRLGVDDYQVLYDRSGGGKLTHITFEAWAVFTTRPHQQTELEKINKLFKYFNSNLIVKKVRSQQEDFNHFKIHPATKQYLLDNPPTSAGSKL